jgi:inner membrane protein involved in colicin E2 resistance
MTIRQRLQIDSLLRHLTLVGFGMLIAWSLVGLYGTLGGILEVNRPATLRFLLVVMLLVYAHHFLVRMREWRLRRMPPDERYGFAQASEGAATGSPQPSG